MNVEARERQSPEPAATARLPSMTSPRMKYEFRPFKGPRGHSEMEINPSHYKLELCSRVIGSSCRCRASDSALLQHAHCSIAARKKATRREEEEAMMQCRSLLLVPANR